MDTTDESVIEGEDLAEDSNATVDDELDQEDIEDDASEEEDSEDVEDEDEDEDEEEETPSRSNSRIRELVDSNKTLQGQLSTVMEQNKLLVERIDAKVQPEPPKEEQIDLTKYDQTKLAETNWLVIVIFLFSCTVSASFSSKLLSSQAAKTSMSVNKKPIIYFIFIFFIFIVFTSTG